MRQIWIVTIEDDSLLEQIFRNEGVRGLGCALGATMGVELKSEVHLMEAVGADVVL